MSRNLLILALWVSGTGCSATRPLVSNIIVTPPRLSFRTLPPGESCDWTPVAVTYPSGSYIPDPCAPSPAPPAELATLFEEDEPLGPPTPNEPFPAVTMVVPAPPAMVHYDEETSPQSVSLPDPNDAADPSEITPLVQAASTATFPDPPAPVEPPSPTESHWKPATGVALVSSDQTSTTIQCDLDETSLTESRQVMPVESLSPAAPVPSDLSELLTECRNQRQLIESLQRDLARERSADNAAIDELEAAVEDLLVHTKNAESELPTTLRK